MAIVYIPSGLTSYTGGLDEIRIEAPRVGELKIALIARFPGLADHLRQMAVAINGQIINDADYQPLSAGSEVHLVPRISGG